MIIDLIISNQLHKTPATAREEAETSHGFILQYNAATKGFAVLVGIIGTSIFTFVSGFAYFLDLSITRVETSLLTTALLVLFVVGVMLPVLAIIDAFGTSYSVTDEGIAWHRFWSRDVVLRWDEIDVVSTRWFGGGFTFESSRGKITVPEPTKGLRYLAEMVRQKVPSEKWKKANKEIRKLLLR